MRAAKRRREVSSCGTLSPSEQGQLQDALGSIRGIATLIGPGIFSLTFAASIGAFRNWNLPGAAWLLSCALLIAAMALANAVTRSAPRLEECAA